MNLSGCIVRGWDASCLRLLLSSFMLCDPSPSPLPIVDGCCSVTNNDALLPGFIRGDSFWTRRLRLLIVDGGMNVVVYMLDPR